MNWKSAESSGISRRSLSITPGEEFTLTTGDPDPDPNPSPQRQLHNNDFIFVASSMLSRLPLLEASRYWRKGMRAVYVMDQPVDELPEKTVAEAAKFHESFAWYPSFKRMANDKRDHYLEGDRRGAMAPVLAYAVLTDPASLAPYSNQSKANKAAAAAAAPAAAAKSNASASADPFQWMLAGDDDTIFFMRGVKALLRDYDPQLPYFLSDFLYVGSKSPQPGVWEMRCHPCHGPKWRRAARQLTAAEAGPGGGAGKPKGCGCSTQELCRRRFPGNETKCQREWEGPVPYGGVGFIFSIGFFKALAAARKTMYGDGLRAFNTCVNAPATSIMSFPEGSDAFMSRCLWRLGLPLTDPGYTPLGRYFGEVLHLDLLHQAPFNLTRGQLPPDTLRRWSTAASMHLFARQRKSFRVAALTIKYISGVYDLIAEMLWPSG